MKLNLLLWLCFFGVILISNCKKADDKNKPEWAKKDIRDYNDADLERLLDQWEVCVCVYIVLFRSIGPRFILYEKAVVSIMSNCVLSSKVSVRNQYLILLGTKQTICVFRDERR